LEKNCSDLTCDKLRQSPWGADAWIWPSRARLRADAPLNDRVQMGDDSVEIQGKINSDNRCG